MIGAGYAQTMAQYNAWQNRSLYEAASTLDDAERRAERGAFWGSIHGTLCHLLWGDRIWMSRFAGTEQPTEDLKASAKLALTFAELSAARATLDAAITAWADGLDDAWLAMELGFWSRSAGREIVRPRWLLVAHMFNHQTHHRGQVHAMLTAAGAKPDDTDLPLMPRP